MSPEQIAAVADRLNRAYHAFNGDESQAETTPLPRWLLQALDESLEDVAEPVPFDEAALRAKIEADVRASLPIGTPATPLAPLAGHVAVRYIGHRDTYRDGAYGTGLTFERGQTRLVPKDKARLMLRHADVYVLGESAQASAAVVVGEADRPSESDEEQRMHDLRDSVQIMTKASIAEYVKTNFRIDLNPNMMKVDEMRQRAIQLIDQYGVP